MNATDALPFGAPFTPVQSKTSITMRATSPVKRPVRIRFDRFELDESDARLRREGNDVPLAPRVFAVLCELARTPQMLVTKNALLDAVWGHRFVSESVLKTAISEVRAALDDDPKQPRYIETVSRRGYRFIAATIDESAQRAPATERNVAAGRDHPALMALTALCRGDAALAELIRAVAATLERDPLASTSPSRECIA